MAYMYGSSVPQNPQFTNTGLMSQQPSSYKGQSNIPSEEAAKALSQRLSQQLSQQQQQQQQQFAQYRQQQQQSQQASMPNMGGLMGGTQAAAPAAPAASSALVAGGPGSGVAASYGGGMGLEGAVQGGGLGTYAGGTGAASSGLAALGPVAAVVGGADLLDKTGISSWGDTLKGKAPSNIINATGLGDGVAGNLLKSSIGGATGDYSGLLGGAKNAVKDLFSFKWF